MLLLGMHIPMDGQVENIMPLAAHVISNRSITVESKQRNANKNQPQSQQKVKIKTPFLHHALCCFGAQTCSSLGYNCSQSNFWLDALLDAINSRFECVQFSGGSNPQSQSPILLTLISAITDMNDMSQTNVTKITPIKI